MSQSTPVLGTRVLIDVKDYDGAGNLRLDESCVGLFLGVGQLWGKPSLRFQRVDEDRIVEIPGTAVDLVPANPVVKYVLRRTGEVVEGIVFVLQWVAADTVSGSSSVGLVSPEP